MLGQAADSELIRRAGYVRVQVYPLCRPVPLPPKDQAPAMARWTVTNVPLDPYAPGLYLGEAISPS